MSLMVKVAIALAAIILGVAWWQTAKIDEGAKPVDYDASWQPPVTVPASNEPPAPIGPKVEVVSIKSKNGYIFGEVKNVGDRTSYWTVIQFNLIDEGGRVVGNTSDQVSNLEPGGIWRFKAAVYEDAAATYKITGLDAYSKP